MAVEDDTKPLAVRVRAFGPPATHTLEPVRRVPLGAGEVRIKTAVAGVGYVDALIASGLYQVKPELPFTPGSEFAGRITEIGEGVTGFDVGDRVVASAFTGGFAEEAIIPASQLAIIQPVVSYAAAVALRVNYTTAWHALVDRARLTARETLLVLGGAGGTGVAAVQVGKLLGAQVVAAVSTAEKRELVLKAGADVVVPSDPQRLRDALKSEGISRVDVVFDPVGGQATEPAFRSLGWKGRHLVIGFAGGTIPKLPTNLPLLKGAALIGVDVARFAMMHEPRQAAENFETLMEAVAAGRLTPILGQRLPLAEFAAALSAMTDRRALAKTLLIINEDEVIT